MKKREIIEGLDSLIDDISLVTEEICDDEIRSWLMSATIKIWAGNKFFSDSYAEILSVFKKQEYSVLQVTTALNCVGKDNREMKVPMFFQKIVSLDIKNGTSDSRSIADAIGRFLVLPALFNGDFTIEEARALREISDMLIAYCDDNGVVAGKSREYHPEMITPLHKTGYYQSSSDIEKPADKDETDDYSASIDTLEEQKEEDATITLKLKLITDENQEAYVPDTDVGVKVNKPSQNENKGTEETLESVMAELNSLIGLDKVKKDVQSLINFIKICQLRTQRGMKVPTISYHLVFTGNPGTGKTTVARIVAKLYYLMGILPQGQLVETDRSGLVAGYLGQTAIKTQKVIQEALGGVLFIDEAYSLANDKEDSYGKEAIETILKAMEDHRDELVVIVAGYDDLMHKFIDSNPGLRSRFNKYFHFPDYDGNDLLLILKRFCDTNGYALSEDSIPYLQRKLNEMYKKRAEHFGNARSIRNLFENAINHQANRLVMDNDITDRELMELTMDDILRALEEM